MKQALLALTALLFVISASAVVGGPNSSEGELTITSESSSASGSVAVDPNGTSYSSKVAMRGTDSNITNDSVENISYSENRTSFTGFIQAPTPCHVIDQETSKLDDSEYSIDVQTVKENESQQCVQQTVMIKYSGSFEAQRPHTLEISHNNQLIETLKNGDTAGPDPKDKRKKGFFSEIMNWFGGLF